MQTEKEPELFVLDQAGIAFRGKVPAYVARLIIDRYWKDEEGWWYLTKQNTSVEELSIWIASRDWFDEAFILGPGSTLWLNMDSHYVHYVKKSPLDDPNWQPSADEMWLVERDQSGVHVTHYLLTEEEVSKGVDPASPLLLEWYKGQALRIYSERVSDCSLHPEQRWKTLLSVADEVTPWDAEAPDLIALLIAEPWLLKEPLMAAQLGKIPPHRPAETLGDLFLQRVYLSLVSTLEAAQEQ
ncbi:hypothetical protein KSF_106600 [Reticulibacter mediterranei]|uniref:Uncharacterized protein n=1 Tax=Reticulibacter mediterranei TaxID=2778369 RepID=A0A8J3N6Q8_9CHLR|nr:hypothetical protein [Reticulibacter mediterranei]GHP00613.1 hypothetical protein KSF_106600 [Reticulibacter mediterranei]